MNIVTKVMFEYDEIEHKWAVFVEGVKSETEALQAFNSVVISCEDAIPEVSANKAKLVDAEKERYELALGVSPVVQAINEIVVILRQAQQKNRPDPSKN